MKSPVAITNMAIENIMTWRSVIFIMLAYYYIAINQLKSRPICLP
jgi:hypothetical protein